MTNHPPTLLSSLIQQCRYEIDVDKQFELLQKINSLLPKTIRLRTPSLITDDYIRTALDRVDEYLLGKKRMLLNRKLDVMYDTVT
ncbi:MAG: hypothetical protein M3114_00980 [Thermoproteota archaeon]|nr:hypothetical protein [Thermoproteota archaeon]MDQ4066142.1 hypothetical protein [Thermoproteota archaeon]